MFTVITLLISAIQLVPQSSYQIISHINRQVMLGMVAPIINGDRYFAR